MDRMEGEAVRVEGRDVFLNVSMTEADADWIRAARAAREGDAQLLLEMQTMSMVIVDPED